LFLIFSTGIRLNSRAICSGTILANSGSISYLDGAI
jgi:hypothetical protein